MLIRKAIYTRENESALTLSGEDWNFHGEDTKEHLHSLHPYPAKFIPQIPRKAIGSWSNPGDLIYDPFCGSGTSLLESKLMGRRSVGTDNNSVAILASKAKLANYTLRDLEHAQKFLKELGVRITNSKQRSELIPTNKNFLYWFQPDILEKLAILKGLIQEEEDPIQSLLMAVFSSIIVRVSYQDSDTRYSRKIRDVPVDDVEKIYTSRLKEVLGQLPAIMKSNLPESLVYQADSRNVPFIESESVSLIITSPPYLNAYDYHKYHRQRIHWIDGKFEYARDVEIGSHDEFTRNNATPDSYFSDMNSCFKEWARVLKRNGHCLIVVGDAIVSKKAVEVGDQFIDLLNTHGLVQEQRWIRTLQGTKRSFNVKNSRISHEHVLLVKKSNFM